MMVNIPNASSYAQAGVLYDANGVAVASDADGKRLVTARPYAYAALGHYRVGVQFVLLATQAANSRLFVLRNNAANLIVVTQLWVKWLQTAAHTAAIEDSIDAYKLTGFTVLDTTDTVTPTVEVMRTTEMAAVPGGAQVRHVTVAGKNAGMTGGTSTKGGRWASCPKWLLLAVPTGSEVKADVHDLLDDNPSSHPLILKQNEGLLLENRVLLGAAAGSSVYIECGWAEVAAF